MFSLLRSTAAASRAAHPARIARKPSTPTPLGRFSSTSSSPKPPTRPCPTCSAPIPLPASPCPSCGGLIPVPAQLSLHSLLSLSDPVPAAAGSAPAPFDISAELDTLPAHGFTLAPRDLRDRMLKRQAALHPDRHGGGDLAATLSARINKAYETLVHPLRRAEYILQQYGMDTKEREGVEDHDLLMEILEAREELDEASGDEIEQLREANHAKVEAVTAKITAAFSRDPPDLDEAKRLCVELKYWVGLEEAAKEKL